MLEFSLLEYKLLIDNSISCKNIEKT